MVEERRYRALDDLRQYLANGRDYPLVTGLIEALPQLMEAATQIIAGLVQGIAEALPELIPAAVALRLCLVRLEERRVIFLENIGRVLIGRGERFGSS